jgi:hypothetical protein
MSSITEDTAVEEVITNYPNLVKVFIERGLPCLVCGDPFWGTVGELARKYNVDGADLVSELNKKKDD